MRSGTIREQDKVVWVGSEDVAPVGSSFKAGQVTRTHVELSIGGTYQERLTGAATRRYRRGVEVVSCQEAGRRGIEPWTRLVEDNRERPPATGGSVADHA